jgi:hypothetical protein
VPDFVREGAFFCSGAAVMMMQVTGDGMLQFEKVVNKDIMNRTVASVPPPYHAGIAAALCAV